MPRSVGAHGVGGSGRVGQSVLFGKHCVSYKGRGPQTSMNFKGISKTNYIFRSLLEHLVVICVFSCNVCTARNVGTLAALWCHTYAS